MAVEPYQCLPLTTSDEKDVLSELLDGHPREWEQLHISTVVEFNTCAHEFTRNRMTALDAHSNNSMLSSLAV